MRAVSAEQPSVVKRQDEWKHPAEGRQSGDVKITAVSQPSSVKIVAMKNVRPCLDCRGDPPGAGKIEIFTALLTLPPAARLSHDEPDCVLKVTDAPQRSQRGCNAFGGGHAALAPPAAEVVVGQFHNIGVLTALAAHGQGRTVAAVAVRMKQLPGHRFRPAGLVGCTDLQDVHRGIGYRLDRESGNDFPFLSGPHDHAGRVTDPVRNNGICKYFGRLANEYWRKIFQRIPRVIFSIRPVGQKPFALSTCSASAM